MTKREIKVQKALGLIDTCSVCGGPISLRKVGHKVLGSLCTKCLEDFWKYVQERNGVS